MRAKRGRRWMDREGGDKKREREREEKRREGREEGK